MNAQHLHERESNLHPKIPTFKREFLAAEKSIQFGERLRTRRLELGISRQEELGLAVGRSKNSICEWEAGTIPRASNLENLVAVLLTTEDYLVYGIGSADGPIPPGPAGRVRATLAKFNWTPQDLAHAMAKRLPHWNIAYALRVLAGLIEPTDDDLDALSMALNLSPRSLVQSSAPRAPQSTVNHNPETLALALALVDAAGALRKNPWNAVEKTQVLLRVSGLLDEMDPASRSKFQVVLSILLA